MNTSPTNAHSRHHRLVAVAVAVTLFPGLGLLPRATAASNATNSGTVVETYDDFSKPGYALADYERKWSNTYGLGEIGQGGTRSFRSGAFQVKATPYKTGADFSVYDHLKYIAISNKTFPVPATGSVEFTSTIRAATPGTQPGRVVHGEYVETGAPYAQPTLEGQQAGAVMNMVDFRTGQLFDWFVSGRTAFALIERLPSNVTNNTTDPSSPDYVGPSKMYTQIIKEIPSSPRAHQVGIRFSRTPAGGSVDYMFDGVRVAHIDHVGVPLDRQNVPFTGIYPSLGAGEELGSQVNSLAIGHGLFSLLDAFPFQHPDVPELAVSIPLEQRLFGQGTDATFDDFRVKTVTK